MRILAETLLGILLAGGAALQAQATQPLTKITVRAMPQDALAQRLFGDLGRIMLPAFYRGRPDRRPTRPLSDLQFMTIPVASGSPGLCKSSVVSVLFAPDGPLTGADTPVRPTGIETSQLYLVADLGRLRRGGAADEAELRQLETTCGAIDPRQRWRINAPDEQMLVADLRVFADLLEAARTGPLRMSLSCPGDPAMSETACQNVFARLDLHTLSNISRCDPPPAQGAGCFALDVGTMSLRFESDSLFAPPSRVIIEPMIVVAEEGID